MSWERILCGFSTKYANSYRVWNPRTRNIIETRNVVFIKPPPYPIPQPLKLSPLQQLQSPSLKFTEDTLDDNYVSSEKMLRDVRVYTAALDFNIDIPADRGDVRSESPRGVVSSFGGATPEKPVSSFLPSSSKYSEFTSKTFGFQ